MTESEKKEISEIIKRILVGNYQHNDIRLLLIAVRDHTKNEIIRELGNFVAHPQRNQGLMHDRVFRYYDQLASALQSGSPTLDVELPITEDITIFNLIHVLLDLFPTLEVYINRLGEQANGIQISVMCILQGASFHRNGVNVPLRWGVGENSNFCLFANFQSKYLQNSGDVSVIILESSVKLTEANMLQEPPFGCYVRDGLATVHMLW
ncbi:hypothetical protein [Geomonas anaerohicana]|uniref:Uncharacterized protein n=1 Tax=Geomonas anaerohicana TaxID=2798583 RepID=A0ABS0YBA4_9BACT|nr:hypothetical protein [Geomonas anaerohicana]MBJ6749555.1 hypothetical protein [Geomonas anaerohicana]